jgi:hypothetical protein
MKKLLVALSILLAATAASAQWNHRHYSHGNNWVAPLIIGGIAGALIARESQQQPPVIVQQQPQVIVQQPPVFVQQYQPPVIVHREPICSEWREILTPDGRIYRERSCYQN